MSLFGLFERRVSVENPAVPLTQATLLDWMAGPPVDSGVVVNENTALTMSAVYRCTSLISSVSAALPLHVFEPNSKNRSYSEILANPHPELTPYELWKLTYVHRCVGSNAYLQKIRDRVGRVRELWPITPTRVKVGRLPPTELNPSGKVFSVMDDKGEYHARTSREIMHLPGLMYDGTLGLSLVRVAAQGIGMALAAERYGAKLFGSGNLLSGILKTEQRLAQADAEKLQARWRQMMSGLSRAHDVAVLDSGAAFQSLTMPNDEAQLLESRQFQINDVCRFWGVPPFLMMQTEKSSSWGTGLEQQALGWVKFDLGPQWLVPTEQRVSRELLMNARFCEYAVEGLLRGDSQARAEFYRAMHGIGAYSVNEIRELENRPPVKDGDVRLQPLNMVPLGTPPPDPAEAGGGGGDQAPPGDGDDNDDDEPDATTPSKKQMKKKDGVKRWL